MASHIHQQVYSDCAIKSTIWDEFDSHLAEFAHSFRHLVPLTDSISCSEIASRIISPSVVFLAHISQIVRQFVPDETTAIIYRVLLLLQRECTREGQCDAEIE